jgi:hypothetical protein
MTRQYISTSEKVEVSNYPYGRLRTTAFFSIEFNAKKGFRSVFQTINPKNGRLNAEKKSTYSCGMLMYRDENNHIKYDWVGFNGKEEMQRGLQFLAEHHHHYTKIQLHYLYMEIFTYLRADMQASAIYKGKNIEELKPLYKPAFELLVDGINNKGEKVLFTEIIAALDWAAIEAVEAPENYQPFKVTSYSLS